MPRTPAFDISRALDFLWYHTHQNAERAHCKIHAVKSNKYAQNSCTPAMNPPVVCKTLPSSLGRLSMLREVPNRRSHRNVAPELRVIHSLQIKCDARLLSMHFDQGFCQKAAARHVWDRRNLPSQVLAELAEIKGERFRVWKNEAQLL